LLFSFLEHESPSLGDPYNDMRLDIHDMSYEARILYINSLMHFFMNAKTLVTIKIINC